MFHQFVVWLAGTVGRWGYPGIVMLMARRWSACGATLTAIALLTAWGRVYSGIHFPFDMAGSLVVGLVSAGLMCRLARRLNPLNMKLILVSDQLMSRAVRPRSRGTRR